MNLPTERSTTCLVSLSCSGIYSSCSYPTNEPRIVPSTDAYRRRRELNQRYSQKIYKQPQPQRRYGRRWMDRPRDATVNWATLRTRWIPCSTSLGSLHLHTVTAIAVTAAATTGVFLLVLAHRSDTHGEEREWCVEERKRGSWKGSHHGKRSVQSSSCFYTINFHTHIYTQNYFMSST